MFKKFTNGCVRVVNRWLPDAFLFAIILTIVVFIAAMCATGLGPIGIVAAWGDAKGGFWNLLAFSMQMALVLVFGSKYLGFPTLYSTRNVGPSSVLPIVCLSLASIAGYALWTRRYMVDELTRDYIKLARVKGLSSSEIMFKHVLRNAMVPMVQYIPQSILLTVGGSLLMERFFSVPGMGPLLTDAIQRYDLNVVQTLVILYAVLGIVGVFLGDVLMMLVDPRITLTGKEAAR